MADKPDEPLLRILKAQQANIARIDTDVLMPGTTGEGENIRLWGPQPDIIRLYDTPLRMFHAGAFQKSWQRVITIGPLTDENIGRVVGRVDRSFRYAIQFLVRLTEKEQQDDRDAIIKPSYSQPPGVEAENPLAEKAHRLVYDFAHVFWDRLNLPVSGCPQGLVDDATYRLTWEPGVEYPMALFVAEVVGTRSAW